VSFTFNIKKPEDIKSTFKKLKQRIEKYKGRLTGDDVSGSIFSDGVEGSYAVKADFIEITVHKKPLPIIPNIVVENEIRKIFLEIMQ
jgi:hypothetical protein